MKTNRFERMIELSSKLQQFAASIEMLKHFFEVMDFEEETMPELKAELKEYLETDMVLVHDRFKEEIARTFPTKTAIRLMKDADASFKELTDWLA